MAPLEPWERVWIDGEVYQEDIHSLINCTSCHLGINDLDMDIAHEGMVSSPTDDAQATCGQCHEEITIAASNSLHNTLRGYDTVIYERSLPEDHPQVEDMQSYHCNSCHATCGDCHVSQPSNVGGGLLDGHDFVRVPSMSQNCTACHGSRVKNEYYGLNEGVTSDVHFRSRMACVDCHTGDEMHGIGITADHRYDGAPNPACESCHLDQVGIGSDILQHELHGTEILSCQTCHSVEYTNCTNCHVERTVDTDIPFFSVEAHSLDFAIGYNVLRSNERPYLYTTVRHVPIDIDSFSFYDVELDNFNHVPTWSYATPHNIQRNTPQTESCIACHGNDSMFLTADRVAPEEREANLDVIVEFAPPLPEGYENIITGQENVVAPTDDDETSDSGDFWGGSEDNTDDNLQTASDDKFWGSDESSEDETESDSNDGFWGDDETTDDNFWGGSEDNTDDNLQTASDDEFWGSDESSEDETESDSNDSFWGDSETTDDDFWGN